MAACTAKARAGPRFLSEKDSKQQVEGGTSTALGRFADRDLFILDKIFSIVYIELNIYL